MSRLCDAGYPTTVLKVNHRSHPQIIDFYNRELYRGVLTAAPSTSHMERVGIAWDSFAAIRRHFRHARLHGVRRLFINATGTALQRYNSSSWRNSDQVNVAADLLHELYRHRSGDGHQIRPEDVMIISPYRDQRNLITSVLGNRNIKYRDNLTIDTAQGQEANVVIFLMTKPAENASSFRFIADKHRLNVALSRAKKVMITIGNLHVWDSRAIVEMRRTNRNKMLANYLHDVTERSDILTWAGPSTVQELELGHGGPRFNNNPHPPTPMREEAAAVAPLIDWSENHSEMDVDFPPTTASMSESQPRPSQAQVPGRRSQMAIQQQQQQEQRAGRPEEDDKEEEEEDLESKLRELRARQLKLEAQAKSFEAEAKAYAVSEEEERVSRRIAARKRRAENMEREGPKRRNEGD